LNVNGASCSRACHVIVSSAVDDPWSQYFCCLLAGRREFVEKHPIATKRYLRAIPPDPFTHSPATWVPVPPEDPKKGGIYDVRSPAKGYERW